ncbi:hypothetical protein GCM10010969_28440 [Saccharibacillus kuerlensis]|uniref:Uncharacterized protein n=1 Tax=Saccharibacillus kuerlensis TaxID=459527 RepID=A0ABQ2L6I3_9BACL|nr:hypothetical protein GCM10010969_28440 [Saccharibacillus kuerlensis]
MVFGRQSGYDKYKNTASSAISSTFFGGGLLGRDTVQSERRPYGTY